MPPLSVTTLGGEYGEVGFGPATRPGGGTSACVADPDGYRLDLVHNPAFSVAEDGTATV